MPILSDPAIAWLFDGSPFSQILLTCLGLLTLLWVFTRWPEWGMGLAMVLTLIVQMMLKYH